MFALSLLSHNSKYNSSKAQIKSADSGVDGNNFQARLNRFITVYWLEEKSRPVEMGEAVHLRSTKTN